ncbi:hypothetical protein PPACK8108_LOCUS3404 [Phakopsora pachyrhizi]|uniref:Uncharacterized protein n=1 Tax=Phakopsora pachyrhizi TaxID=170000 RepID=A0AAV0ANL3_PHAPC|nr:hypothetical protein PPACK8108_LOCUS3404 [Phakopsora pachyrhizi]
MAVPVDKDVGRQAGGAGRLVSRLAGRQVGQVGRRTGRVQVDLTDGYFQNQI